MRRSKDFEHNLTLVVTNLISSKSEAQSFTRFAARRGEPLGEILKSIDPSVHRWAIASWNNMKRGQKA